MTEPVTAVIGIGSNMGDREAYCGEAVRLIARFPNTTLDRVSSLYETAPLEMIEQDWFINLVAAVRTTLSPQELLQACQEVEQFLGRKRSVRFGPRTIDLDILFYDDRIVHETDLTIPHPRLHERRFVLEPMAEIAPELVHPVLRKSVAEILKGLPGRQEVRRLTKLSQPQKTG